MEMEWMWASILLELLMMADDGRSDDLADDLPSCARVQLAALFGHDRGSLND
jgi:hypothetical protein